MERKRTKKQPKYIWLAAVVVLVAVILLITLGGREKKEKTSEAVAQGVAYLSGLEKKDPNAIRQVRREIYVSRMLAQKDELTQGIRSGEIDPFPLFEEYAILGDSRAVGYSYSDFLPDERVLAEGGNTIRVIPYRIEELVALNPSYIYLCYGINDINIGFWDTAEEYAEEYMQMVALIEEALPETTVVISSTLPAKDPAFERAKRWRLIPDWNKVLEQTCKENGVLYANCDWLYEEMSDLWDQDGIHLRPAFYPYWAGELITTALYGGFENEA